MASTAKYFGLFLVAVIVILTILSAQGCNAVSGLGRDITAISTSVQDHYADDHK